MRRISELIEDLQRLDPDTWTDILSVGSEIPARRGFESALKGGRRMLLINPKLPTPRLKPTDHD